MAARRIPQAGFFVPFRYGKQEDKKPAGLGKGMVVTMKKKAVRIIGIGMALAIVSMAQTANASSVSEIKKQQAEEQKKLNNVQGQISGLAGKQNEVSNEIEEIDSELVEIIASVDIMKEEIANKELQIQKTQEEHEEAKKQEEEQYAAMKQRIKFMYEQGDISYLQIFLTSESYGEMVNKADYVEQLYKYDRDMLEKYKEIKDRVKAIWNRLEDEKSELEAAKHELEEEQAYMEEMLEEKKQEYDNYNVQLAKAKQEAAAYKTRIKQQNEQIKKIEEAERKKAEEERKKKEAAAAAAAAASGSNNSGQTDSSSNSGGDSAGSSSASSDAAANIPSGGSGAGQGIASYACQFIGNPYVAGGTSLTDGADCSGFVWRVFKDKGYSVPRTSWELRNAGYGVDYSQAQPGDIICYAGHVAIYIGNGNIVHASTERTGIKITNASYKPIIGVRRVG